MTRPQSAILDGQNSRFFYFLEYQLLESTSTEHVIKTLKSIGSASGVHQLIAFGPELANQLLPATATLSLSPMHTLSGPEHQMPSTQADLLFWLHGIDNSDVYDQVLKIQTSLTGLAKLTLDQPAFTYHDSKDLIGFEDGTANPKEDARLPVACIQDDSENHNGAIVFTQKWRHKLEQFLSLPVTDQEKIVGRTKVENIELEGDDMPADSHVSRTDVKLDGEAMKIYRRSAPYGNATDKGLMFLCFACHQKRIQIQLERMVGCTDDGLSDHLMKYSDPISGSYFYAPSQVQMDTLLK
ncbi:Dyp-type peroxidase [Litoribrevibacter albus]|uniref:Deferrochelatase/peroxidase YfeX n=1 Tax=Litoribrevibacter albus TaxID=1473156 RepID=A0AA37W8H0_9GAMM|nr:Dyp-type peroxidase [Litoribrevibacter albus]GLQ32009.1 deferrochelatase/peroxidase YfeX [Litoribrevibacter albus]